MRVLVTGGAGFVGSHVVDTLLAAGHDVSVFDMRPPLQPGVAGARGDLTVLEDVLAATAEVDAVCHLAAVGDVYLALRDPAAAAAHNVTGTACLMEACLRNGVRKVVYASTWEVYGEPQYEPMDEAHPCNPDHPYNITKLAGEQLALAYDRLKDIPAVALRLGTAYGTRMRPNAVFSLFVDCAMQGQPLTINGSGRQARQFTHVRDIGSAFLRAVEAPIRGEKFNIVAPELVSILELAQMVAARFPTRIEFTEGRLGDVATAVVSADKARQALAWRAEVPFEQGLDEIFEEALAARRMPTGA